jgi:SEC-C motif-containing protein
MRAAATAEQLMRSRYTAFVIGDAEYLLETWHPETRPRALQFDSEQRWLGLKVKRTARGLEGDGDGVVEFIARYKIAGRGYRLHEISRFACVDGCWLYVDGEFPGDRDQ